MNASDTGPGVVIPSLSSGSPFGSVMVTRAVIVPSAATLADTILPTMPGRMEGDLCRVRVSGAQAAGIPFRLARGSCDQNYQRHQQSGGHRRQKFAILSHVLSYKKVVGRSKPGTHPSLVYSSDPGF